MYIDIFFLMKRWKRVDVMEIILDRTDVKGEKKKEAIQRVNPYTLHPTPYTLHPTPYTLHPTSHTPHTPPDTPHPSPTPCTPDTTYTLRTP